MSEPVHTSETPAPEQAAQPADGAKPEESQDSTDWKAEARKWEQRAKENNAKASEYEKARKAAMTEAERAVAEAEERGRMSAVTAYGERLARTEWIAEAARRNPGYDAAGALEDLNVAKFIGEDGEPNAKAIAASVARLVPEGSTGPTPPPSFDGGTRQPVAAGGSMTDLIRKATGRA
jgi:hypothetical protein